MKEVLILGILALVFLGGCLTYMGIACVAIIRAFGTKKCYLPHRVLMGIWGVVMIYAFVCACIYITEYGWIM
ncbi:MAG: hypothetical protein IJN64_10960 [Lachnospiraceae bacterium]|nr:hypothetical protein [Lachnospiraceae bacterium]